MQEAVKEQREKEKEEYKRAREAWDRRRKELEGDIARHQKELKQTLEKLDELEKKQKVMYEAYANDWHSHLIRTDVPASISLQQCPHSQIKCFCLNNVPVC